MMQHRIFSPAATALLLGFLVVSVPASADSQTLPGSRLVREADAPAFSPGLPPLSLADLLRFSLEQNPALRQADLDVGAAQGRALQASLYPNPRVELNGEEIGARGGKHSIDVSQEIVTANKLGLSRAVAEREVDQAVLAVLRQRATLFTTVRQGYFEVLAVQRRIEVLNELVKLATESYENAKKVLGAGEAAKPDMIQFQIELERLRADLDTARREHSAAWRRLAAGIGDPHLPLRPLTGSLEAALPEYDFDRAQTVMLQTHPEVRSAQVGITRAQFALKRAEAEAVPNVTLAGGYTQNFTDRESEGAYHLSVPIPLFNRNQGNIHAAKQELGRAILEVDQVENNLITRLATAFGQYASARERSERYRTTILPSARESYNLTLLAFRGGQFEYLRVLQAQRAIGEANLTYIQSLSEQWRAASEIAGLLLDETWSLLPFPDGP